MTIHPLAGKPAPEDLLIDAGRLQREYYARKPDFTDRTQRVGFGTSGHRGSSLRGSFNETHNGALAAPCPIVRCPTARGTVGQWGQGGWFLKNQKINPMQSKLLRALMARTHARAVSHRSVSH